MLYYEIDSTAGKGENITFSYNIGSGWNNACSQPAAGAGVYSCNLYSQGIDTPSEINALNVKCLVDDNNGGSPASFTLDSIRLFVNISGSMSNATNITIGTGTTSFEVVSNIVLNISDNAINLGTVAPGQNMSSENTNDWFAVRNDGTVNFDLYAYGAAASDSPFASTTNGANQLPNNYYLVHANNSLSGVVNITHRPVPATVANKTLLVENLAYQNGIDGANIGIFISVPGDEPAGSKSAALTLYAEAS